jgi:hypothetical protein
MELCINRTYKPLSYWVMESLKSNVHNGDFDINQQSGATAQGDCPSLI